MYVKMQNKLMSIHSHSKRHIMLPLKVYLCNAWMKSQTPIHTKKKPLRNNASNVVGVSLTDNHHLIIIMIIQRYLDHAARPSQPC